jgi:hypothetical protein
MGYYKLIINLSKFEIPIHFLGANWDPFLSMLKMISAKSIAL